MQPTIAMKFAEYVVWILLYKHCKFGEKVSNFSDGLLCGTPCMQACMLL